MEDALHISGELKSWDKFWMCWPLWTSLVVPMRDDIENTSVGADHVIRVTSHSHYKWGKVSTMLHKGAGDSSNSQFILKWPSYYIFFNNSQAKKNSK